MALSFLQSKSGQDALGGIASLISGIYSSRNAKKAVDRVVNLGPTPAEARSNALFEALLQPNNSLVKQQQEENAKLGIEGLLTQIRQMQNADRRAVARGRRGGTFSDPERRDEFLDYSISRGLPYIQQQALNDARTNIGDQARNISGFAGPQSARQQASLTALNNYDQFKNTTVDRGIQDLLKLFKRNQSVTPF